MVKGTAVKVETVPAQPDGLRASEAVPVGPVGPAPDILLTLPGYAAIDLCLMFL